MMMRLSIALSLAAIPLLALPLAAQEPVAAPPANPVPLDRIVAVVGDQPITLFDVQERILQKQQLREIPPPQNEEQMRAVERQVVNEMVDEELLLQKAKELKVEVTDNELATSVDRQLRDIRAQFASESEFRGELAKAGLGTPEEYRRFLMEQMRKRELMDRVIRKLREDGKIIPANVSDAEVREAFEKNKAAFPRKPESVTFRQIIVNPKPSEAAKAAARAKAESLLVELRKGADFELIAKRESMDPTTKDIGGDLGWQRVGVYFPEFERWLFGPYALSPGNLSPVVETPLGYHIIRVDRVKPGEVKAHHILIRPMVDSAQIQKARLEADTVAAQWRAGAAFDSLAKKHHDYANKEETSILNPFPRDSLPDTYRTAFTGKGVNDIAVFQIPGPGTGVPKFVVAQLLSADPGGERTLDEMRQFVRDRLAQEGGMRRYLDSLRKENFVSIRLDTQTAAKEP